MFPRGKLNMDYLWKYGFAFYLILTGPACSAAGKKRTNFVVLFADDIGWGDFGANWEPNKNNTPNLNWLAEHGMRLTDFHSGSAVCTPSRAALLTGRLGLRTGVKSNFVPNSVAGLPLNETTIAEVLVEHGYHTGMVGKWHLGITNPFNPKSRGFKSYYGLPYSNDMGCVDDKVYSHPACEPCGLMNLTKCGFHGNAEPLYHNYDIIEQPVDLYSLNKKYTLAADNIIKTAVDAKEPFFMYMAFAHMHVPLAPSVSVPDEKVYATSLKDMDAIIGGVINSLKQKNVFDDTLIWFTGDNGPWTQECLFAGSPGPFLGSWITNTYGGGGTAKQTNWEGGHREPAVVVWPKVIKANTVSSALTSAFDIFPTLLSIANVSMPKWRNYDGMDLTKLFKGDSKQGHSVLYHPNSGDTGVIGEIDTIRMGKYKAHWKTGGSMRDCEGKRAPLVEHNPPLIFNLDEDFAEANPITEKSDPHYKEIIYKLDELRQKILLNIAEDNTTIADYATDNSAYPCCNKNNPQCRCKPKH